MQFAHAARLDLDQGRGDGLGYREEFGVGDAHRPAFGLDRRLRQHAMAETFRHRRRAGDLVGIERPRKRRREDVELARVGHVGEGGSVHAEILGQHVGRHVLDPVTEQEGVVLVEIAVVEHQQKLGAVGTQALNRMRDAWREIPQVADADVVDEIAALRIDRGDARGAVEHVGPFGGLVPMQLAHAAGIEPHVDAGDILGNAKLAHRHLPGPAARLQAHVRSRRTRSANSAACRGRWPAARGCPGSGWHGPDSSDPDWCRPGRGGSVAASAGAVCACATVAAESAPPAAATASMSRREMEFEILLIFLSWSLSDWPPPRPSGAQPSIAQFRPLPASMS